MGVYNSNTKTIELNLKAYTKHTLLNTIAHELRHAYQHMYDTTEWNGPHKPMEVDAVTWAKQTVSEFGETQEDWDLCHTNFKNNKSWMDA